MASKSSDTSGAPEKADAVVKPADAAQAVKKAVRASSPAKAKTDAGVAETKDVPAALAPAAESVPVSADVAEVADATSDAVVTAVENTAQLAEAATDATQQVADTLTVDVLAKPIAPTPKQVRKPLSKRKPAAKLESAAKPARRQAKPATKTILKTPVRAAKRVLPASIAAPARAASTTQPIEMLKETLMAQMPTYDLASKVQDTMKEMTEKAKAAYEKSNAMMGEYSDFAKGNVEAVVESGKILASGMQDMSRSYVAEGKSAFETMTAEVKELVSVKSPAEFFTLQSALMKKHFDDAMAYGSKSSEGMLKLASEAFAPLSTRMSVAIDKVKAAA